MATTRDLLERELGVRTRSAENRETEAMTTTEALVFRADSGRLALQITNLGTTAVHIRPAAGVSTSVGVRLAPSGGFYSLNWKDDFSLVTKEWFGIAASGTPTIYTLEELIEANGP